MLTPRSNTGDLLARLSAVPGAVQVSTSAALAAYVRARSSGVSKAAAIGAYSERTRAHRLHPDREQALARFDAPALKGPTLKGPGEPIDAVLKQAAVQGALNALGRAS